MLHLIGENLDKSRAHYQAETGKIVQLVRGIYADSDDNIDDLVLRHAVRIAHYLYPRAYLAAASSVLLAPTRDGRLLISGPRSQRTRIRSLEIIQNKAPHSPSTAMGFIKDGLGEFQISISTIRQRFLEAFRLRSEHAASIDDSMRDDIVRRLVEEHGSAKAAADAVWTLARENEWYREGEQAERYLRTQLASVKPIRNEAAINFTIAWHGRPIGALSHDGFEWRWRPGTGFNLPLVRQTVPGKLPSFILSLLPEGWLETVLKDPDERAMLKSGKRYMSNIAIAQQPDEITSVPADILISRLANHNHLGLFTGDYEGPGFDDIAQNFEKNIAQLYSTDDVPRLSGVQLKVPMFLNENGALVPSVNLPFTHILKPGGTGGFQALALIEFLALKLGRSVGFEVPEIALIVMPDKIPPALVVERFDIRRTEEDIHLMALEDMCSVLDLPPESKYNGTIERIIRAVRPLSTSPEEDTQTILQRALFAWLIADGDLHLKNLALLKTTLPGSESFETVKLAPLYDAVTTKVFPQLENDRMALALSGKDDRLKRADFQRLGATSGLSASKTNSAIDQVLQRLSTGLDEASLSFVPEIGENEAATVEQMLSLCRQRLEDFS